VQRRLRSGPVVAQEDLWAKKEATVGGTPPVKMAPGARDKPQKKKGGQCCAAKQGRPAEGSAKPPRSAPASSNDFRLALPDSAKRDELFRRVDYNGNGILSLAEIDKAVLELWPQFDHKRALMRAYKAADRNGDGFIRRREFRLLLKYIIYFNDMWERFDEIDRDHDHRLTLAEFVAGCVTVGIQLTQATAAAEFSAMDENGGGYVLFDEFCHWCARRQVPVEGDAVTAEEAEMLGGAASTGAAAYDDDDYDDDDEIMVVVCPDGMTAGDMVVIETPDGREVDVEIPNGVSPGEEFEVFVGNETGNDGDGDRHDDDAHTEDSDAPDAAAPTERSPSVGDGTGVDASALESYEPQ
jgi:Ca2+-binding EF-hand superfamily protein